MIAYYIKGFDGFEFILTSEDMKETVEYTLNSVCNNLELDKYLTLNSFSLFIDSCIPEGGCFDTPLIKENISQMYFLNLLSIYESFVVVDIENNKFFNSKDYLDIEKFNEIIKDINIEDTLN